MAERVLGKNEVAGSIPAPGSMDQETEHTFWDKPWVQAALRELGALGIELNGQDFWNHVSQLEKRGLTRWEAITIVYEHNTRVEAGRPKPLPDKGQISPTVDHRYLQNGMVSTGTHGGRRSRSLPGAK